MEQVLAPNIKFLTRLSEEDRAQPGEIKIGGFKEPSSRRVKDIIQSDMNDLKATILQDASIMKALPVNLDPEIINKVMIPKIIKQKYPDLSDQEVEEVRQHVVLDSVVKNGGIKETGDKRFIRMAGEFINIDELNIDLIDRVNPFQKAFEILSKTVTPHILKLIQETIEATRIQMTEEEAIQLYQKARIFKMTRGRAPNLNSTDSSERRMAEAIVFIKRKRQAAGV